MTRTCTRICSGTPSPTTGWRAAARKGDLMRLLGWPDRSMVDLYGADLQVQRAIQAKRRRGDIY
jgi:hypothetical protein